ncbi:MAG TPA: TIM-barrel domain-containing protein, partial [Tepidisphaeraceae bacterium]|nr:TIM-barrel domain-containing protein [Tepidisphaeraceae bacterium]
MKSVLEDGLGVRVGMEGGELALRPVGEGAIRVRFSRGEIREKLNLVFTEKVAISQFTVWEDESTVNIKNAKLQASVERASGAVTFWDSKGKLLLKEKAGTRVLEASTVMEEPCYRVGQGFESPADERLFGLGQFQDGYLNVRDLPRRLTQVNTQIAIPFVISSKGYGLLWHNYGRTEFNPADRKVELSAVEAQGETVRVDVTSAEGTTKEVRTEQEFVGMFSVERAGRYALMLDVGQKMARRHEVEIDGKGVVDIQNYWLPPTASWLMDLEAGEHRVKVTGEAKDRPAIYFRASKDETVFESPVAEALDYVVIAGEKTDEIVATYRELTGSAPMMPEWAYGFIHCRERFRSQQDILENAAEFRKRKLPMDVIVQDWQYWGKYGWNAMQFDETHYPDPAGLVRALHEMNVRLMVSVWSKVAVTSDVGKEMTARGYYLKDTTWIDFFNPEAAGFYWKNFSERLVSLGIDAWWQDATEPENDDLDGRMTHVGIGNRVQNVYPLLVTKTVYEGLRKDEPEKRVFVLTRSAYLGQQRYAAATWSGDIGNDWETLRRQIPAGLNFVVTGQPYWTTDCGGFFRPGAAGGAGQFEDEGYRERLVRWFEYATFCPMQRIHGYQTNTEPWRYGEQVEGIVRRYLELRYRLLPYIYSTAWQVTNAGSTMMRPLVMDFAGDEEAVDQTYEFMFGPGILVSPVVEAGKKEWEVYLPKCDGGWVDFWTGEKLAGGQKVKCAAGVERIPLHVRAGAIVPMGEVQQFASEKRNGAIELRVYPGADGKFVIYEDEGTNYNYEKGKFAEIAVEWKDLTRTLVIGERRGEFAGMVRERVFNIVVVKKERGVGIDPA